MRNSELSRNVFRYVYIPFTSQILVPAYGVTDNGYRKHLDVNGDCTRDD